MNDRIVRKAFHQHVLTNDHEKLDTFVIDEFGLRNGEARADIAVINGKMIGYEIKTENDTLIRLSNQVLAYNEVFDRIYIITTHSHLEKVVNIVPVWWGIYLIKPGTDLSYAFILHRKAQLNKWRGTLGLVRLLWKDEVLTILNTKLNFNVTNRVAKEDLYDILSGTCATLQLSKWVISFLKNREGWRKDLVKPLQNDGYSLPTSIH